MASFACWALSYTCYSCLVYLPALFAGKSIGRLWMSICSLHTVKINREHCATPAIILQMKGYCTVCAEEMTIFNQTAGDTSVRLVKLQLGAQISEKWTSRNRPPPHWQNMPECEKPLQGIKYNFCKVINRMWRWHEEQVSRTPMGDCIRNSWKCVCVLVHSTSWGPKSIYQQSKTFWILESRDIFASPHNKVRGEAFISDG